MLKAFISQRFPCPPSRLAVIDEGGRLQRCRRGNDSHGATEPQRVLGREVFSPQRDFRVSQRKWEGRKQAAMQPFRRDGTLIRKIRKSVNLPRGINQCSSLDSTGERFAPFRFQSVVLFSLVSYLYSRQLAFICRSLRSLPSRLRRTSLTSCTVQSKFCVFCV